MFGESLLICRNCSYLTHDPNYVYDDDEEDEMGGSDDEDEFGEDDDDDVGLVLCVVVL